ncbi:MAG: immunoglobulin domain-containing protein [Verrucomicrobiota bacterium]
MKIIRNFFIVAAFMLCVLLACSGESVRAASGAAKADPAPPVVSGVSFVQRAGTNLVDVTYTLSGGSASIYVVGSSDGGATYTVAAPTVSGDVGGAVAPGVGRKIVWNAGADLPAQTRNLVLKVMAERPLMVGAGGAFAPIPNGTYVIGDALGDGPADETPVGVVLSPYYMSVKDTTKAQWDVVRTWGLSNGYTDLSVGAGKASNHPVQTVSWYDAVKWANAASEKEGLTPCYKVGGAVYRTGSSDTVTCDWSADGYRLPTEAEWEVAARGGLTGKRFPLGDEISHSQANYYASSEYLYDLSGLTAGGYHPAYAAGGAPNTSPVGSFAANGYGIYDMAGNVGQWCWNWYEGSLASGSDPRGADSGTSRVLRGGDWDSVADNARCGFRYSTSPNNAFRLNGFRLARGAAPGGGSVAVSTGGLVTTTGGGGGNGGTLQVDVQPQGADNFAAGGTLTLSVSVSGGAGNLKYRWYRVQEPVFKRIAGSKNADLVNGSGEQARFHNPEGMATDGVGNVYVADAQNHAVRKISASGDVTTLAGGNGAGLTNGSGSVAQFDSPSAVAVDKSGNVYVADTGNRVIRKIATNGEVSTFAGDGAFESFGKLSGITVDGFGNLYVADADNQVIWKITPTAEVSEFAGDSGTAGTVDGAGHEAQFDNPESVVSDAEGNLLVLQVGSGTFDEATSTYLEAVPRLRKVSASGVVQTVDETGKVYDPSTVSVSSPQKNLRAIGGDGAGNFFVVLGFNYPNGYDLVRFGKAPAVRRSFFKRDSSDFRTGFVGEPLGVVPMGTGAVLVTFPHGVVKVPVPSGAPSLYAGRLVNKNEYADGVGPAAEFPIYSHIATGTDGNVYVLEYGWGRLRKVTPAGVVTTLGTIPEVPGFNAGIAVDGMGNVFVSIPSAHRVFRVTAKGQVSTFAGTATVGVLDTPRGVAVDSAGNVYIADAGKHKILKATSAGVVTVYAGNGQARVSDGALDTASFDLLGALAMDGAGRLYVLDRDEDTGVYHPTVVRRIAGGQVETLSYSGIDGGLLDLAADVNGEGVYLADYSKIYRAVSDMEVETVGGSFERPSIAVDKDGSLVYLTDGEVGVLEEGGPISGQVTATLRLENVSSRDAGNYKVVVTDESGATVESALATVTVLNLPVIVEQPEGGNVQVGEENLIALSVAVKDADGVRYQWQRNGTDIEGETGSVYVKVGVTAEDGGVYRCVVSSDAGSVTSAVAVIQVVEAPKIVSVFGVDRRSNGSVVVSVGYEDGEGVDAIAGQSLEFVVEAVGTGQVYYQWRKASRFEVVAGLDGVAGAVDGVKGAAKFGGPSGIAVGSDGSVYVADTDNSVIRKITPAGVVSTIAGSAGVAGLVDGAAKGAKFNHPQGIAVGSDGTVYVADTDNNVIRKITQTGVVSTVAGSVGKGAVSGVFGFADGAAGTASFAGPRSIAVDSDGNLYVGCYVGNVRRIDAASKEVTSLSKIGDTVAVGGDGKLYVADGTTVSQRNSQGEFDRLAGSSTSGSLDGDENQALFFAIRALVVDGSGVIYAADGDSVRKIVGAANSWEVSTIVKDKGVNAPFGGIGLGGSGEIYVSDGDSNVVRKVLVGGYLSEGHATGTTTAKLTINSVSDSDKGGYECVVSDTVGSVVSGQATVRVQTPPPSGRVGLVVKGKVQEVELLPPLETGTEVTLGTMLPVGTDGSVLTYQWRRNGFAIPGARGSTYALGKVSTAEQEGTYDVVIGNGYASVVWDGLLVQLKVRPVQLVSTLQDLVVLEGSDVEWSDFKAVAGDPLDERGSQPVKYVWSKVAKVGDKPVALPTQTEEVLKLSGVKKSDAGVYTVTASNAASAAVGSGVVSSSARLTVLTGVGVPTVEGKRVALAGESLTFRSKVTGDGIFYQWLLDGEAVFGAEQEMFTVSSDVLSDGQQHTLQVVAYNVDGYWGVLSVNSSDAFSIGRIEPISNVFITPLSLDALALGSTVTLSANFKGDPENVRYQWYLNGQLILKATDATYTIPAASAAVRGNYTVSVSNSVNTVVSEALMVDVLLPLEIVRHPVSTTVNGGAKVTLSVVTQGGGNLRYEWYKDGGSEVLFTGASYTFVMDEEGNAEGDYRVRVSTDNPIGGVASVMSFPASIYLERTLLVRSLESNAARVKVGEKATFTVHVTSSGKQPSFRWRKNGVFLPGGITQGVVRGDEVVSVLQIDKVKGSDDGEYDVVVSEKGARAASGLVKLRTYNGLSVAVTPPGDLSVSPSEPENGQTTLTAAVVGDASATVAYQWKRVGSEEVLSTEERLRVQATDAQVGYFVEVRAISDEAAGIVPARVATSAIVPVQLTAPVVFTEGAGVAAVVVGGTVTLSRNVQGGSPIQFQWQQEQSGRFVAIKGATSRTLTVANAKFADAGAYRLLAKNERSTDWVVSAELQLSVLETELIVTQPVSRVVNPGETVIFSVKTNGTSVGYQWRKNGVAIDKETQSSLKLLGDPSIFAAADKAAREGVYDVVVTSANGTSVSVPATLQVNLPAKIEVEPVDAELVVGKPVRLAVVASGTEPISYEWRKNGKAINGGTQSTLEIKSAAVADAGTYAVLVSNAAGKDLSNAVNVRVPSTIQIKKAPVGGTLVLGQTFQLKVEASGIGLSYQWRRNGVALVEGDGGVNGVATATLTLTPGATDNTAFRALAGLYDVVLSDLNDTARSAGAPVTIKGVPVILSQPKDASVTNGAAVGYGVVATGGTLQYKWYVIPSGKSGAQPVASGGDKSTLTGVVGVGDFAFGNQFYVVVTNELKASVTSATVSLKRLSGLSFVSGRSEALPERAVADTVEVGSTLARSLVRKVGDPALTLKAPVVNASDLTLAYQWRRNGVEIAGATQSTYTLGLRSRAEGGVYDLIVIGLVEGQEKTRILSAASLLDVKDVPVIGGLSAQSVYPKQTVMIVPKVTSSGTAAISYQWEKLDASGGSSVLVSGTVASGATVSVSASNPVLKIENIMLVEAGNYRLTATDDVGSASATVALNVVPLLDVRVTANGQAVPENGLNLAIIPKGRVLLEAAATGAGNGFQYQWRLNGVDMANKTSRLEIKAVQAADVGRYEVLVTGPGTKVLSGGINISLAEALKIVTQPVAQLSVDQGQPFGLSVQVNNPDEVALYQWIKDKATSPIGGQTSNTLTINPAVAESAGTYVAIVVPRSGKVMTSTPAKVSVNVPAGISESPVSQGALFGKPVSFQVKVTGSAPFNYQWYRNGVRVPGANGEKFQITAASSADAGSYQVIVSNGANPDGVKSEIATLSVASPLTITKQPQDRTGVIVGKVEKVNGLDPVLLSVSAEGKDTLSYQWRKNGIKIDGQITSELRLSEYKATTTGYYDVVVRNFVGGNEVSRVVSRQASVVAGGTLTEKETKETVRVNQGEVVLLRSYAGEGQTTNWVLGGTLKAASGSVLSARTKQIGGNLQIRGVTADDAGSYVATVTLGSDTFVVKWDLQVVSVPEIVKQPVSLVGDKSVKPGGDAILSAEVKVSSDKETDADTKYQWYFQSTETGTAYPIPGALGDKKNDAKKLTNTLSLKSVTSLDDGFYRLEISNPAGAASTIPARINVLDAATSQASLVSGGTLSGEIPKGTLGSGTLSVSVMIGGTLFGGQAVQSVDPDTDVTLVAVSTGDLVPTEAYQWYYQTAADQLKGVWSPIKDAKQALLTLKKVTEGQDTFYKVGALGRLGTVDSKPIRVRVNDPVSFSAKQTKQTLSFAQGEGNGISVSLNGYRPTYQWFKDGVAVGEEKTVELISGGTVISFPIVSAQKEDSGTYSLSLKNHFSSQPLTDVAVLDVRLAPVFVGGNGAVTAVIPSDVERDESGILYPVEGNALALKLSLGADSGTFTYQWRKNGLNYSAAGRTTSGIGVGAQDVTLDFGSSVTGADSGRYDLVVINTGGVLISRPVNVLVKEKPLVVVPPRTLAVSKGGAATFSVEATGYGTLSYQWFRDDEAITDATSRLLTLSSVTQGARYRVRVTNTLGEANPPEVRLTVSVPGDFSASISAVVDKAERSSPYATVPGGSMVLQSSVFVGSTAVTEGYRYQWRKNGVAIEGETSGTYTVSKLGGSAEGAYDVVVTDGANYAPSNVFHLDLDPRIYSVTVPSSVVIGDGVTMQVKASSSKTLSYQWLKDGKVISGQTKDTYVIPAAAITDSGTYTVTVSAKGGASTTTEGQKLLVNGKVAIKTQPVAQALQEGGTLTLSVSADFATRYRWYRSSSGKGRVALSNGVGISGADTAKLTVTSVTLSDAGVYDVEVSNVGGTLVSNVVAVTVSPKLSVSIPTPGIIAAGGGFNLVGTVEGATSPQFRWLFTPAISSDASSRVLTGQTTGLLRITKASVADSGIYTLEVTSGLSKATASVVVQVKKVPFITVSPVSQAVAVGGSAKFAVVAEYAGTLAYQWYKGEGSTRTAVQGETSTRLNFSSVTESQFGTYTVRVSDAASPDVYVEVSAVLGLKGGVNKVIVVSKDAPRWWVYAVEARVENSDEIRYGYWIMERIKDPANASATTYTQGAGSVWLLEPKDGSGSASTDVWAYTNEQIQEAVDGMRPEFCVIADRSNPSGTFVIAGKVEKGSRTALYGAAEEIYGSYTSGGTNMNVILTWNMGATVTAATAGQTTLEGVTAELAKTFQTKAAAPKGD